MVPYVNYISIKTGKTLLQRHSHPHTNRHSTFQAENIQVRVHAKCQGPREGEAWHTRGTERRLVWPALPPPPQMVGALGDRAREDRSRS